MSKAEAFEVKFAGNRSINVEVNFSKGDAIKVPVNINSMDADKLAQNIAEKLDLSSVESKVEEESQAIQGKIDNIKLPEIDTTEFAKETTLETQGGKIDRILDIVDEKYATQIDEISALL